jgi:hypothetical protein
MENMVNNYYQEPGVADRDAFKNVAIQWGLDHEEDALALASIESGHEFFLCSFIPAVDIDWFGSTPDALYWDGNILSPVEVKCPYNRKIYSLADRNDYYHQVQSHLFVTEAKRAIFAVWTPDDFHWEYVESDKNWWESVSPTLREFYDEFLDIIQTPTRSSAIRREKFQEREDDQWSSLVDQYRVAALNYKVAEEQMNRARDALISEAQENSVKGSGLMVKKVSSKSLIDYKSAVQSLGKEIDLQPFTKPSKEYWMIKEI